MAHKKNLDPIGIFRYALTSAMKTQIKDGRYDTMRGIIRKIFYECISSDRENSRPDYLFTIVCKNIPGSLLCRDSATYACGVLKHTTDSAVFLDEFRKSFKAICVHSPETNGFVLSRNIPESITDLYIKHLLELRADKKIEKVSVALIIENMCFLADVFSKLTSDLEEKFNIPSEDVLMYDNDV